LTADEFADFLAGKPTPPKSILITFDDGYLDNWVYAHPVLQKYSMHAVLFLITGLIGEGAARGHAGQADAQLPAVHCHLQSKALIAAGSSDAVMLRWSEVLAMKESGTFEFHSHTHTHNRWDLIDESREICLQNLKQDLADSRQAMKHRLGSVSEHFCWPQGYFNRDYVELAQTSGFRYLYTTVAHGQNLVHTSPAHIFRVAVRNRAYNWLRMRIWFATHPVVGPMYNKWKLWKRTLRVKA
jgi:peptidoglycan/xylan/chitin deacetylase (PgdA/CDA1 family)